MRELRSILVHLDATLRSEARLRLALALAQGAQARLTAVYAVTPSALSFAPTVPDGGAVMMAAVERWDQERRERAHATFDRLVPGPERSAATWDDAGRDPVNLAMASRALTVDLVVFGQHDAADAQTTMQSDLVAHTLMQSGTPALLIPHTGNFEPGPLTQAGSTVLVAWKPTREAVRAVRGALPWLRRAGEVVLAVESAQWNATRPGTAPLRTWLELHGVHADVRERVVGRASPGEILLSMAADTAADLLVMGCYGHSRASELILGGASRTVLRSMTLPTLMAH